MAKPEQLVNSPTPRVPLPSLDLLQSFAAATALPLLRFPPQGREEHVDEGLELSLGLSLNGRFGVDPGSSMLARSASIANLKSSLGGGGGNCDGSISNGFGSGMTRTCSLPVDNKNDRKRKDAMALDMLGMAKRRRRIEKLRDVVPGKTIDNSGTSGKNGLIGSSPNRGCNEVSNGCLNGYDKVGVTGQSMTLRQQLLSQLPRRSGSLESEHLEIQGVNSDTPTRSIASVTPTQEEEHNTPGISQASEKPCTGTVDDANEEGKEMMKTVLENMPSVSAKGDGPNGKKVEGFLYRYRKGEEVRIVCVCHGSFFTPAEFVKHAGWGDVANPLKHIVVNTSSTLS